MKNDIKIMGTEKDRNTQIEFIHNCHKSMYGHRPCFDHSKMTMAELDAMVATYYNVDPEVADDAKMNQRYWDDIEAQLIAEDDARLELINEQYENELIVATWTDPWRNTP